MNHLPHTFLFAALAGAALAAQDPAPADAPAAALARARVLELRESDLAAAERAYRDLLADRAAGAVHAEAALRLGTLLWRLDRRDDARPFLERAAAAGGELGAEATAVLQGRGEQGKLAQERLEQARALVARVHELFETAPGSEPQQLIDPATEQLGWLGDAAAAAIAEQVARQLPDLDGLPPGQAPHPAPFLQRLLGLLWRLGGRDATAFFERVAADPKVERRRFVTAAIEDRGVAADLPSTLLRFARDPDLTGEVWENVARGARHLPIATLVTAAADADPGVAAAALYGLAGHVEGLAAPERTQLAANVVDLARAALRHGDPRLARGGGLLLAQFATFGPPAARRVFLAVAEQLPPSIGARAPDATVALDDEDVLGMGAAAGRLGGMFDGPRHWNARQFVGHLLVMHEPRWGSAAVPAVTRMLELYYTSNQPHDGANVVQHAVRVAADEDLPRLVNALPRTPSSEAALRSLAERKPPTALFATLRDLLAASLDGQVTWQRSDDSSRPRRVEELLMQAIHATASPETPAWLAAQAEQRPELTSWFAGWLASECYGADSPTARAGMRRLLVAPPSPLGGVQPADRANLFAALARVGDAEAIPLFVRAYELGLAAEQPHGRMARGIGFLCDRRGGVAPHGFAPAQLADAWQRLLAAHPDEVLRELAGEPAPLHGKPLPGTAAQPDHVPLAALPVVLTTVPAHAPRLHPATRERLLSWLGDSLDAVTPDAMAAQPALRDAVRAWLRGEAATKELVLWLVQKLPEATVREFATEGLALLQRGDLEVAPALIAAGVPLAVADWRAPLAADRRAARNALATLPEELGAALRPQVEATLAHADAGTRMAAVSAVRRLYGASAVASLLPLANDANESVRKLAGETLDQLRVEHERRTFWNDAQTGIDTSPAGAATKLVAQARPGEAKEQRLLAIGSLAVLGAAEPLPYLIEWTKDADAEVAAAARAAIARIHARSGAAATGK